MPYETILYETENAVATITLNRPERLNTIVPPLPDELEQGVATVIAERDGPFGDYSQAPASEQPSRDHVITPGAGSKGCR